MVLHVVGCWCQVVWFEGLRRMTRPLFTITVSMKESQNTSKHPEPWIAWAGMAKGDHQVSPITQRNLKLQWKQAQPNCGQLLEIRPLWSSGDIGSYFTVFDYSSVSTLVS